MEVKGEVILSLVVSGVLGLLMWNLKLTLSKLVTSVDVLIKSSVKQEEKTIKLEEGINDYYEFKGKTSDRLAVIETEHKHNHPMRAL